ncbi:MAG: hypothetical protein U9O98_00100 [Asgard group archaeon]|nr:hypothetical protein [Asgard group archaeon]
MTESKPIYKAFKTQAEANSYFRFSLRIYLGALFLALAVNMLYLALFQEELNQLNREFGYSFLISLILPITFFTISLVLYVLPMLFGKTIIEEDSQKKDWQYIIKEQYERTTTWYKIRGVFLTIFFTLGILTFLAGFVYLNIGLLVF